MAFAMHRAVGVILFALGWWLVGALTGCLQVTIAIPPPSPEVAFRVPSDFQTSPSPLPAPLPTGAPLADASPPARVQDAGVTAQGQFLEANGIAFQNGFTTGVVADPLLRNWGPYTAGGSAWMAPPGVAPLAWQQPMWPLSQGWPLAQAWPLNTFGTPYAYAMGPQVFMIPAPEPEITVVVPTPVPSPVIIIVIPTPTPTVSPSN